MDVAVFEIQRMGISCFQNIEIPVAQSDVGATHYF